MLEADYAGQVLHSENSDKDEISEIRATTPQTHKTSQGHHHNDELRAIVNPHRPSLKDIAKMKTIYMKSISSLRALMAESSDDGHVMSEGLHDHVTAVNNNIPKETPPHRPNYLDGSAGNTDNHRAKEPNEALLPAPLRRALVHTTADNQHASHVHGGVRGAAKTNDAGETGDTDYGMQTSVGAEEITIAGMAFGTLFQAPNGKSEVNMHETADEKTVCLSGVYAAASEPKKINASSKAACAVHGAGLGFPESMYALVSQSHDSLNGSCCVVQGSAFGTKTDSESEDASYEASCMVHGAAFGTAENNVLDEGWGGLSAEFRQIDFDVFVPRKKNESNASLLQMITSRKQ
jgi:hypothetical protein